MNCSTCWPVIAALVRRAFQQARSGVPDRLYIIETRANPTRTVHERTFEDNTARAIIRLSGDAVMPVGSGIRAG